MKRDPALQPERTALAWKRTALAMLVNGALLVRAAVNSGSSHLALLALLVVLAALSMFRIGAHRQHALASVAPPSPHAGLLVLTVAAVWLTCGAALAVIAERVPILKKANVHALGLARAGSGFKARPFEIVSDGGDSGLGANVICLGGPGRPESPTTS